MWNLTGNDVEQAKEQLKGRRSAIKARYDDEMKRVEDELAAIEKFERDAQEFMSQYKSDEAPLETLAENEQPSEEPVATAAPAIEEIEPAAAHSPAAEAVQAREAVAVEAAAEPTGSSRWRLRLNAGAVTEAA